MTNLHAIDFIIILIVIVATLATALFATKKRNDASGEEAVAGRSINHWLLALSAGATANSGFVLTGAVGLGYAYGLVWLLLPIGWFIGDIIFWIFIAQKINDISRESKTVTLSSFIVSYADNNKIRMFISGLLVLLLSLYLSSQWLSIGKIINYIFDVDIVYFALTFGLIVAAYTSFSGIRGAIYTEALQAVFMLIFVFFLILYSIEIYLNDTMSLSTVTLPQNFLSLNGNLTWWQTILFVSGFSALSIGFNVGQPQMAVRWMSAKEDAIKKARWIYIAFVQFTFFTFILLGVFIKLSIDGLEDPEQGLVAFVKQASIPGFLGLFIASAIATIASTGSALLATCGEIIRVDIFEKPKQKKVLFLATAFVSIISFIVVYFSKSNVYTLAITAVEFIGSSFAASVIYIILFKKVSSSSIMSSVIIGFACNAIWKYFDYNNITNGALPSIFLSFIAIWIYESLNNKGKTK